MKVVVTPVDDHYDEDGRLSYNDHGTPFVGTSLTITPSYVEVDGDIVLVYTPGRTLGTGTNHPWTGTTGPISECVPWTGFTVEVTL